MTRLQRQPIRASTISGERVSSDKGDRLIEEIERRSRDGG